jgi:hypothetical protein
LSKEQHEFCIQLLWILVRKSLQKNCFSNRTCDKDDGRLHDSVQLYFMTFI